MDRSYEMSWSKFEGTIKGDRCYATVEMMDLFQPYWNCRFVSKGAEKDFVQTASFEEGMLEQAYEWCKKQVSSNERR